MLIHCIKKTHPMLHFSLRQLEYFAAAARHGSTARAAEALAVSQPSVSKAIADLEAQWGEVLFVRLHARGLALTSAGMARQQQAQALLEQARSMQGHSAPGVLGGLLRVGCLGTLAPRWMPAILARLRTRHPGIAVELREADTETLVRGLEHGSLDVALLYDLGLARSGVRLEPVARLAPYALLPWGHRLARGAARAVGLAELAPEPFVLIDLPHSREYFLSLFRAAGLTPRIAYECSSLEMVRGLVAQGLGVSLLTTRPVRDWASDGRRIACRRLRGAPAPQSVALAVAARGGADYAPLVTPFADAVRHQLGAG